MEERFRNFFESTTKPMLLDGATGTMLMELKSRLPYRTEPELIQHLAERYFLAGSDAVLANTFNYNRITLRKKGLEKQTEFLNRNYAEIARCAFGERFVLGNIGPTGERLKVHLGTLTEKELTNAYSEQVKILSDAGVDGFSLETFTNLEELKCALDAVKESNLPYIVSMSFEDTKTGVKTSFGVSVLEFYEAIKDERAFAIGSNCGNGLLEMIKVLGEFRRVSKDQRLISFPNAGKPRYDKGKTFYDETPEFFKEHFCRLLEYDLTIVGGCCGTTPEHIKVMRKEINKRD